LNFPPSPALPLLSLASLPFIAYILLFFSPITAKSMTHVTPIPYYFTVSFPVTSLFAAVFGSLAFSQYPAWSDILLVSLLYIGW
jgi:zinc transporter 5/7